VGRYFQQERARQDAEAAPICLGVRGPVYLGKNFLGRPAEAAGFAVFEAD